MLIRFLFALSLAAFTAKDATQPAPMGAAPPSREPRVTAAPPDHASMLAARPFTSGETARAEALQAQRLAVAPLERAQLTFALARLHYDAHHWTIAADLFDEVTALPGDRQKTAALLGLDSLDCAMRVEAETHARAALRQRMCDRALRYRAQLCTAGATEDQDCALLAQIAEQVSLFAESP